MTHLFLFPFVFFFLPLFLEVLGDLDSVFFSGALQDQVTNIKVSY